jgi:hypothetical protein
MDMNQAQQQAKKKQQIQSADPVTLVTAARSTLYEIPEDKRNDAAWFALEEVINRFEHTTRTQLGPQGVQQLARS